MKTVVLEKEACLKRAADEIAALLKQKHAAVLAFSKGRTTEGQFDVLAERCAAG